MPKLKDYAGFSDPNKFSFKDGVASIIVIAFVYFSWRGVNWTDGEPNYALDTVRIWVTAISIVLGGYFGQEVAKVIVERERK